MNKNTKAVVASTKTGKKSGQAIKESLKALVKIKSGLHGGKLGYPCY